MRLSSDAAGARGVIDPPLRRDRAHVLLGQDELSLAIEIGEVRDRVRDRRHDARALHPVGDRRGLVELEDRALAVREAGDCRRSS